MLSPTDPTLQNQLESEIKKDSQEHVDLKTAQDILEVIAIDKEYLSLRQQMADTQFKYKGEAQERELRPYQTETLAKLKSLLEGGAETVAVQLPTGAGKTFLIHAFIHENFLRKGKNVVVITPSWEIANQHAMTMCQQFDDGASRVRRLGGEGQLISTFSEFKTGMRGKVVVTTSALFYARATVLNKSLKVGLVIVDEGHHGWQKKRMNSIQAFAQNRGVACVLLTATPPRNMQTLPFAAQLKYLDLVPDYLVKCHVIRLETGQEFDPVIKNGILAQSSRHEISSRNERFEKIVADSIPHIRGQAIYYAGSVREAMGVRQEFAKHGLTSTVVHSKWVTKADKINALAIERFRSGKAQILVNVQMLAMGFDVPNVQTIIVARPVESDTLFTQMVGRGARPSPGKEKFILIDVHDTIFKPEVAKIFEHRELFYSETKEAEKRTILRPASPVRHLKTMPTTVKTAANAMEFPVVIDFAAFATLTLKGRNVAANYVVNREPWAFSA